MKIVILAGGFGTRLSELTKTIPKQSPFGVGFPAVERHFGNLVLGTAAGAPLDRFWCHFGRMVEPGWWMLMSCWEDFEIILVNFG